ncbi:MAG: DUF502 domain-containing protein [Alphaproteobacteria bacterium]|nr:DUF502 domain-containing protein [Alphaproteobacteria bacterium]
MVKNKKVVERAKTIKKIRLEKEKAVFMKLGGKLRAYLFTGILVTAPVAITLYLATKFVLWMDVLVNRLLPPQYKLDNMPYTIPGLGLVIGILFLIVVGMFAAGFLGRFFIKLGEWIVYKVPLVSSVYSVLKQVFETFFSSKTQAFSKVVMLEYPRKGIWILGFVSSDLQGEIKEKCPKNMLSVFIPTTPNPTSGFLIFVPKEDCIEMDMTVEQGLKFVISGGLVSE